MKKIVYILGNPLVDFDSIPSKLIHPLQKQFPNISFVHFDPTEEIQIEKKQDLVLIDTVLGINKVIKFNNLDNCTLSPRFTVHDFDLPLNLGILQKLGRINKITIIGIPSKGNWKQILKEVKSILRRKKFRGNLPTPSKMGTMNKLY